MVRARLTVWCWPTAQHLLERGLAPATVNRRLAALRSLVALARTLGLVGWTLEVGSVKAERYRDTRGPGVAAVRRLLAAVEGRVDPKALRDRAILRLLFDLGLRRAEVVGFDLEHLDLAAGTARAPRRGDWWRRSTGVSYRRARSATAGKRSRRC